MSISNRLLHASLVLAFPVKVARWDHTLPGPISSRHLTVLEKTGQKTRKSQPAHKRDAHFQGPQTKGATFCVDRMSSATRRGGEASSGASDPPHSGSTFTTRQVLWFGVEGHSCLGQNAAFPLIILQSPVAFTKHCEQRCPHFTIFRSFLLAFLVSVVCGGAENGTAHNSLWLPVGGAVRGGKQAPLL